MIFWRLKFAGAVAFAIALLAGCASPRRRTAVAPPAAPATAAANVEPLHWARPALVVFFDRESSAPQIQQRQLLRSGRRLIEERGIDVLFAWERVDDLDGRPVLSPTADQLRQALAASPVGFSVVFVDRTGSVRWTAAEPMNPSVVGELFDSVGTVAEASAAPERVPQAGRRKKGRK